MTTVAEGRRDSFCNHSANPGNCPIHAPPVATTAAAGLVVAVIASVGVDKRRLGFIQVPAAGGRYATDAVGRPLGDEWMRCLSRPWNRSPGPRHEIRIVVHWR